MEAILLIGVPASGKSTFFRERFFSTHVRINLDMLKTRHRELRLFQTCLETGQPFVVDNTNASRRERARYLIPARRAGFRAIGYYFRSSLRESLRRNAARPEPERIPDQGVRGTHGRLELPSLDEGFDALYYVRLATPEGFVVEEWIDEV